MAFPLTFQWPAGLWTGVGLAGLAAGTILWRRPALPVLTLCLAGGGILLMALAAGMPLWSQSAPRDVEVMIDLSPSTRTAMYRTRAALERRIAELLGGLPYHLRFFADGAAPVPPTGPALPDVPVERTLLPRTDAGAVLLFSDAQFDLPESFPPVFVVADPLLESPADAKIGRMDIRGRDVAIHIDNTSGTRKLDLHGVRAASTVAAPPGSYVLARQIDREANHVRAQLSPGDSWPENDGMVAPLPPPAVDERWWVGHSAPDEKWRTFAAGSLPAGAPAYLAPAIIVLDDVVAAALSDTVRDRLGQYVRHLGGSILILGGPNAFAAGGYPGSAIDSLSPLASTPPRPATHWMLLADSSGSMGTEVTAGQTRWQLAADALVRLLPQLPPRDLVSAGCFSEALTWWLWARPAGEAARATLPPASAGPHGPTNLDSALQQIGNTEERGLFKQLLVLTDADARIDDPAALAALFNAKQIRLHVLAIGQGAGLPALRSIISGTGGTLVTQLEPAAWAKAAEELLRSASPRFMGDEAVDVHFLNDLAVLGERRIAIWNRTWLKDGAIVLADQTAGPDHPVMAARWNLGEGQVMAVAFEPRGADASALAERLARPPHDPRFRVSWDVAAQLRVSINALDDGRFLNGLTPQLEIVTENEGTKPAIHPVPQIAPGRYELAVAAPRSPSFASVRLDGHPLDRVAVAGRYAPEFDSIGNDHAAMNELARRTGGQVIEASRTSPIKPQWAAEPAPITSILACAGAAMIAIGLVRWRVR